MNKVKLVLIFTLVSILGCSEQVNLTDAMTAEIENEIQLLKTPDAKKKYLEKILEDDQSVRDGQLSADLMLKYGKNSKEHMEYVKTQWKQDEINLVKIEKYFEIHGYPDKELGTKATTAPYMVIHHARDYEPRMRNFEIVYEAYLNGNIDDGAISFYLGRMYQMKNGERLYIESPFRPEDEINQLIKELGLEQQKAKVEKNTEGS